jgi:putative iron-regulated protein
VTFRDSLRRKNSLLAVLAFAFSPALLACGSSDDGSAGVSEADVVNHYADAVYAAYSASASAAGDLDAALVALIDSPSQDALDAARDAWRAHREPYDQTDTFRFYDGPIDNSEDGPEPLINSWPLDEVYIDYVKDDPDAGIINLVKDFPTIDEDLLVDENGKGGEKDISTGSHAIEFLLWGQDFDADGPGDRPWKDYVTDGTGTAKNQDRRGTYLKLVGGLMARNLRTVADAWAPGEDNYGKDFRALDFKEALRRILTGMGTLAGSELSGERMSTAYDDKDQEDEHSCFSDNTQRDLYLNALGIQNVYLGRYGDDTGPGLYDIVKKKDAALADKLKNQLQATQDAMDAIPKPFDQAILGDDSDVGRTKIHTAIKALKAEADTIVEVATAFDITLSLD